MTASVNTSASTTIISKKKESLGSGKQYLAGMSGENAARKGGGDAQSTAPLDATQQRLLNKQKEAEERRRQKTVGKAGGRD